MRYGNHFLPYLIGQQQDSKYHNSLHFNALHQALSTYSQL